MNTCFTEMDTLLNDINTNFYDDCDMMVVSLTGCIETDSYDTSKWTDKLNEAAAEVETIAADVKSKNDQLREIYDSVFGNGG